ncbi:uncharacterized protein LOC131163344 [Malania oleifera]|uniref:uncharacterized protein LOC131163344 n=1 Tax=Malania oleifera TaxID=397392 RepID=UPI0025AE2577|nr:uncharacterized protein LOC131163344 [Malania oleifera]
MADGDSYGKLGGVGPEVVLPSVPSPNQANPSKFYSHFFYKAAIVAVFLVILPLFPSEAPEFVSQTLLTRSWELLHLLFVGIAVSYGLFSRRNDEAEKENPPKFDSAQSYVSRFLQVSSVFDDEAESPCGSDENKVQAWSSQYYREEPVVVLAKEDSVFDEQRVTSSRIREKSLGLPVRSLKSRVSDADVEPINDSSSSLSRSSSNLGSKRVLNNSFRARDEEFSGLDHLDLNEKFEDNVVLRSPIPWRSRSGRMEMKEESESEFNRFDSHSSRSQISRSSNPNSIASSPKNLSPSPSLSSAKKVSPSPPQSSESLAKSLEDFTRRKIYHKSSPPPAPPLPPPITRRSLLSSNSSLSNNGIFSENGFRTIESRDLSRSSKEDHLLRRANSEKEAKPRTQLDSLSMGRSVRTAKVKPVDAAWRVREIGEDEVKMDTRWEEVEATPIGKTGRKLGGFDQVSVRPRRSSWEGDSNIWKSNFSEFQDEERNEPILKFIMESDDEETENEDDDNGLNSNNDENGLNSGKEEAASGNVSDGGPDVDKKADEFIAKFREQIRLQRIESIKRSSGQLSRNSPR